MVALKLRFWSVVCGIGVMLLGGLGGCCSQAVVIDPQTLIGEWSCYLEGQKTPVHIKLLPRNIFESVIKKSFYTDTIRGYWLVDGSRLWVIDGVAKSEFEIVSPVELRKKFPPNPQYPQGATAIYRKMGGQNVY